MESDDVEERLLEIDRLTVVYNPLSNVVNAVYGPRYIGVVGRSCPECQKTATRRADDRHTMVCPPVIGEPFRRLGIDIVGPLPRSWSGNKYVLTIIDHGTRYPEAIPMQSMEATCLANILTRQLFGALAQSPLFYVLHTTGGNQDATKDVQGKRRK
ncbi:hypothetical protein Bbelb_350100 [Branchiostoma belcheri]|nr:hypothetical protein Bbelb_350100 [Branchiostoma belcheri]